MKSKRVWWVGGCLALFIGIALTVFIFNPWKSTSFYSPESPYPIVDTSSCVARMYTSVAELYNASDVVAEVVVNDHHFEQKGFIVHTYSHVGILELFKGDPRVKELKISEFGGQVNTNQLQVETYGYKQAAKQGIVEDTLEGSPTIRTGNQYILFLMKVPGQDYYDIVGNIQGKIKIDSKNDMAVATVEEQRLQVDNMFILQKLYAGKNIDELEKEIVKYHTSASARDEYNNQEDRGQEGTEKSQ